jgi:hypothetical protein
MFADFTDLIALFNKHNAKYLVIGGYAVSRHAQPRYTKDFEDKGTWYTMGVPPYAIDILPEIPGVTFDAAWNNRSTQIVDAATGLTAHFISRDDLISAKLAAGRDQDLIDVKALRHAAAAEVTAAPTPPTAPKPRKSRRK